MDALIHPKGLSCRWETALAVAWLAILGIATLHAQQSTTVWPTAEQRAVATLRQINTAEARYYSSYQHYGTRTQLLDSKIPHGIVQGMKQSAAKHPGAYLPPQDIGSQEPVPGYSLSVYLGPDGSHYIASLSKKNNHGENPCGWSFYTDDSGLIQQAKPIGCK